MINIFKYIYYLSTWILPVGALNREEDLDLLRLGVWTTSSPSLTSLSMSLNSFLLAVGRTLTDWVLRLFNLDLDLLLPGLGVAEFSAIFGGKALADLVSSTAVADFFKVLRDWLADFILDFSSSAIFLNSSMRMRRVSSLLSCLVVCKVEQTQHFFVFIISLVAQPRHACFFNKFRQETIFVFKKNHSLLLKNRFSLQMLCFFF